MKVALSLLLPALGLWITQAPAQSILFDFNNAPVYTSLPATLTVGGVSAQFSATGPGYSFQSANTMGFTPVGFSGTCLYPNGIQASDLTVTFSQTLTDFSILYAPQELACDSSARLRVTAYLDGTLVGTTTTNAVAGTWPSQTLAFRSRQGFNRVVVHYDAPPPTGGDYGTIFLADNMQITLAPPPVLLSCPVQLVNGAFQFAFTNTPNASFSVLTSTNASLPVNQWTVLGSPTQVSPGQFQFTDPAAASGSQRFYRVRSP